jgi:hypothetical protein
MSSAPPPELPGPLADWIAQFGGVEQPEGDPPAAAEAALRALREALARPGRNREGAFALLAADALLTEASRGILEAEDPEEALIELMDRIAGEEPE